MTSDPGAGCVFLLTDYGTDDEFAGLVRAAVVRAAPGAPVVDLTHGIPPFDVAAGARALERCVAHLGPGVVVGVVDPGVGTDRRPVALEVAGGDGPRALVGPDNGLLLPAADVLGGARRAVVLPPPVGPTTFDGRDVFAPAAARLWAGHDLASLGPPVAPTDLVRLPLPQRSVAAGSLRAEVVWVDRFGNVQLAAGPEDAAAAGLGDDLVLQAGEPDRRRPVRWVRSFGELAAVTGPSPGADRAIPAVATVTGPTPDAAQATDGELPVGLLVDASGRLALVCDRAPAAVVLGLSAGDVVVVHDAGGSLGPAGPDAGGRAGGPRGGGGR